MSNKAIQLQQKQKVVRLLPQKLLASAAKILNPIAHFSASLKINPNIISTLSLFFGIGAGLSFVFKLPLLSLLFIILSGACDTLDGKIADEENKRSLYGAIYDSTIDRYAEFFIYLGIAIYFRNHWALWIALATILGSFMVSYTRARAEGLGIECKIGFMQRAERLIILSLAVLIGVIFRVFDYAMIAALSFIALFSNYTALQRTFFVRRIEKQR